MFVERFFVEGLAHVSYLFGTDGEAAVVDPKRDVDDYLAAAERYGARIVAIFETHPHADFVSGHVELAERTGATIYVSEKVAAQYAHHGLKHGEEVMVGSLRVKGLETPGHSPDSMSFYTEERFPARAEEAQTLSRNGTTGRRILFSGDVLFVGDVGRPDLRDMHADPRAMAAALYDTLHRVLYRLPEDTVVYPAHGAGSLCGRKLGSAQSTTIGAEKQTNWTNQFETREAFVEAMVSNLPDRPLFFYHCPFVNLDGARSLAEVPKPRFALDQPDHFLTDYAAALILDTRTAEEYGTEHIAGSLNIGLSLPTFSTWVGFFVQPETPIVLVVDRPEDADRAWLELARIGYENVVAYMTVDVDLWMAAGLEVLETPQIAVCSVERWLREDGALLDVRTPGEWSEGHVGGARWIPLPSLPARLNEVPAGPLAVICGSGYRSSLATSLLERAGRRDVLNIRGGWAAWTDRQCVEPDARDLTLRELVEKVSVGA